MRVFVTGATGFIGSAIVWELIASGHSVLGLARTEAAAEALAQSGVMVQRGELSNVASLAAGARASDGVIHTAFIHDFSRYQTNAEIDRRAIETMGRALAGSARPLVVTSGIALLAPGRLGIEDDPPDPTSAAAPRIASEEATLEAASRGVRASIVRLPPSVHGEGDHGFVPALINIAREKGVSAYVGEGLNRWSAVHRLDAADLYRLALETGSAAARFHGVADEGVPLRAIAEVIGRRLHLPVVSIPTDRAADHFGWLAHFVAIDCPASSAQTRERLGWNPHRPGLTRDLDSLYYFQT